MEREKRRNPLAVPYRPAIIVDAETMKKMQEDTSVILDALQTIRKVESGSADKERLKYLDDRIKTLEAKKRRMQHGKI